MNRELTATLIGGGAPFILLAAIAAAGLWWGGSAPTAFTLDGLPEETVHNYQFAEQHAELLDAIPCYCGCHRLGHGSLLECYLRPEGGFEQHASGCGICGWETDDVERLLGEGDDPSVIRTVIDEKYAEFGAGTDTPGR